MALMFNHLFLAAICQHLTSLSVCHYFQWMAFALRLSLSSVHLFSPCLHLLQSLIPVAAVGPPQLCLSAQSAGFIKLGLAQLLLHMCLLMSWAADTGQWMSGFHFNGFPKQWNIDTVVNQRRKYIMCSFWRGLCYLRFIMTFLLVC